MTAQGRLVHVKELEQTGWPARRFCVTRLNKLKDEYTSGQASAFDVLNIVTRYDTSTSIKCLDCIGGKSLCRTVRGPDEDQDQDHEKDKPCWTVNHPRSWVGNMPAC